MENCCKIIDSIVWDNNYSEVLEFLHYKHHIYAYIRVLSPNLEITFEDNLYVSKPSDKIVISSKKDGSIELSVISNNLKDIIVYRNLPTKWKDCIVENETVYYLDEFSLICSKQVDISDDNIQDFEATYPTAKLARSARAEAMLIRLVDTYNGNLWKADFTDLKQPKYSIGFLYNIPKVFKNKGYNELLTFKSEELAKIFLDNFKELIYLWKGIPNGK